VFAVLAFVAVPVWLVAWRWLPETRRREQSGKPGKPLAAMLGLISNPSFIGAALLSGLIYAQFFAWVSLMPYVFKDTLGHSPAEYGAWYLSISGGYFLGNLYLSRHAARIGTPRLLRMGLAISAVASIAALGLAAGRQWQPIALFGPWAFIAFGQGLSLPVLTANAVSRAPSATGAASGLLGFAQQIIGALAIQVVSGSPTTTPMPAAAWCALFGVAGWAGPMLLQRRAQGNPR
jgi:DHA1 family bicyclomycin/chloramphenicol resistance-like MFS transporter